MQQVLVSVCVLVSVAVVTWAAPQQGQEPIAILRLDQDGPNPDGTFQYSYETANGIKADASGRPGNGPAGEEGLEVQGSFSFKGDDGVEYSVQYTAGENGFVAQGAHLPTPPPIPEAILKSIEFNEKNPEPQQSSNRVDNYVQSPQQQSFKPQSAGQRRPYGRY